MLKKVVEYGVRHRKLISLLVLTLAVAVAVATIPHELNAQSDSTTLTGTVAKVDSTGMKLTIKDSANKEETLTIESTTKITRGGKDAKLADVKEGDSVKVTRQGTKVSSVEATAKTS